MQRCVCAHVGVSMVVCTGVSARACWWAHDGVHLCVRMLCTHGLLCVCVQCFFLDCLIFVLFLAVAFLYTVHARAVLRMNPWFSLPGDHVV